MLKVDVTFPWTWDRCFSHHMSTETKYTHYREKAREAFKQSKYEKALKLYEKALKKHKPGIDLANLEQVHVSRAVCLLELKEYEKAVRETDKAIELNDQFAKAYFRKAEAKSKLGLFAESLALYDHCLSLCVDPDERDLVHIRRLAVEAEQEDARDGVYFKYLIPGTDYCQSMTLNPITKVIFEIACQMRNIIYVVGDRQSGECLVVDPCWDVDGILRALRKDGMRPVGVIQTHNHFDHVGGHPPPPFHSYHITVPGTKRLLESCGVETKVYIHQQDADLFQTETNIDPSQISTTTDNQELWIGKVPLRFMHTPGHTPGSQCVRIGARRLLTGDTLFIGSCGRVDLPGGDAAQMYHSLYHKLAKLDDDLLVYPAHLYANTAMSTIGVQKRAGVLRPMDEAEWMRKMMGATGQENNQVT